MEKLSCTHHKRHHAPHKTLPWPFRTFGLALHILSQLTIIAAIVALWAVSNRNYGITSVLPTPTSPFEGGSSEVLLWTYSLLWTAVPAFLMARYTDMFTSTLNTLKSVQIILELCNPSTREPMCACGEIHRWGSRFNPLPLFLKYGHKSKWEKRYKSTPGETILLDYDSFVYSVPLLNSWMAYSRRHYLVSICMFVKFLLTLTGGLAAAILAVANVGKASPATLQRTADFDGWALSLSSPTASLRPATDVVSAVINNGAESIPWMTTTHAFRPFFRAEPSTQNPGQLSYNLSGLTTAYSATLDCEILDPVSMSGANGIQLQGGVGNNGQVIFRFTDRGCSVRKFINLLDSSTTYFKSWAETECGGGANYSTRFGFFSGISSTTSPIGLDNLTIVSCIPTFWKSSALVTVTAPNNKANNHSSKTNNRVIGASITSPTAFDLKSRDSYLGDMPLYAVADPSDQLHMDTVGRISYEHALSQDPVSPLASSNVLSSFETIFAAVFASMSSIFAFNNTSTPELQPTSSFVGVVSILQNRLFIVWQPAAAVIAIVSLALIITTYISFIWIPRSKTILLQNQELVSNGILGYAMAVNRGEGVTEYIDAVEREALLREELPVRREETAESLAGVDLVEVARKEESLRDDWECGLEHGRIQIRRREGYTRT